MNTSTISYALLSWNVRGLGDSDKCTTVRNSLSAARLDIVCLQETKLSSTSDAKSCSFLPPTLSNYACVDAAEARGGLITAWNTRSLTMTSVISRRRSLTTVFSSTASDYTFTVTNVYAPADHRESAQFLFDIEELAALVHGNWIVAGDFNLTRGAEDNSNGAVHQGLADAFNDTIHKLGLIDMPLLDRLFTWSNHRDNPTLARLDRVFINAEMSVCFPNSSLTSLPKPTSDHTPILLKLSTAIPKPNLFRFENGWLKHPDYLEAVLPVWRSGGTRDAAASLVRSLKAVRGASKVWARGKRAPPTLQSNCNFVIYMFDVFEEGRCLSAGERALRALCRERLVVDIRERAAYWKQRGKCRAILEGDCNTRFFHARASHRMRCNQIRELEVAGVLVSAHDAKTNALTAHLRGLLSAVPRTPATPTIARLYTNSKVTSPELLVSPFTHDEARAAVRAMNRNSSPGPDGFGPGFYMAAWDTVSSDILRLAAAFHAGQADLERLNRAYVVMLPKHATATKASDYRPICLQNCSLKIIAKMLTTRLPTMLTTRLTTRLKSRLSLTLIKLDSSREDQSPRTSSMPWS
ncbi:unnamed protein product [Urochloa humidicola]